MKTSIIRILLVIGFASLALVSHASDDEASIQALIDRYNTHLNAGDTDSIMGLYGQEPVFMPQNAPAQRGRAAVARAYAQVFSQISLKIRFQTHALETFGDTAWARTSSAGETRILANGSIVEEGNNELFVFKREQGQWKIHQYLFASNLPARAAK